MYRYTLPTYSTHCLHIDINYLRVDIQSPFFERFRAYMERQRVEFHIALLVLWNSMEQQRVESIQIPYIYGAATVEHM